MDRFKIPKILQVKGVHPNDCVTLGSIFNTDRLLTTEIKEDSIPAIFSDKQLWITKTPIKCINCTLNFDSVPVPFPLTMQRKKNDEMMFTLKKNKNNKVIVFCSFECLINHIYLNIHIESDRRIFLKIVEHLAEAFGVHPNSIKRGLGHLDIDSYGGEITVKKFREQIHPIYWNG
jgi:hypothetical protein